MMTINQWAVLSRWQWCTRILWFGLATALASRAMLFGLMWLVVLSLLIIIWLLQSLWGYLRGQTYLRLLYNLGFAVISWLIMSMMMTHWQQQNQQIQKKATQIAQQIEQYHQQQGQWPMSLSAAGIAQPTFRMIYRVERGKPPFLLYESLMYRDFQVYRFERHQWEKTMD